MAIYQAVSVLWVITCLGCASQNGSNASPLEAGVADGGADCGPDAAPYWSEPGCEKPPSGCADFTTPTEDTCPGFYEVCACDGTVLQKSCGGLRKPFLPLGTGTCHASADSGL